MPSRRRSSRRGEEGGHQRQAAADAPPAVLRSHAQGSRETAAPCTEEIAQRALTLAQADVLERSDLVERGRQKDPAGHPAPGAAPHELLAEETSDEAGDPEGEEARW